MYFKRLKNLGTGILINLILKYQFKMSKIQI